MEKRKSAKLKNRSKKVFSRKMHNRLRIALGIVLLLFVFLVVRIIYLYNTKGQQYSNATLSHLSYTGSTVPYQRGTITDRNGVVLAECQEIYNVVVDPSVVLSDKDNAFEEPTLKALSSSFGLDYTETKNEIENNRKAKYRKLADGIPYEKVSAFKELQSKNGNIKGVWFELEYKRVYPYGSLASHVIGYTNAGNVGTYGIEQQYNKYLNGSDGSSYGYYDNELNLIETTVPAQDGDTVVSTIDTFSQTVVEDVIAKFLEQYHVNNIGVILMNPNNGEIYAMASNSGYDLNNPRDLTKYYTVDELENMSEVDQTNALNKLWRNFALCDTYEPGSTYKLVTVAGALEESAISTDDSILYNCQGSRNVAIWNIRCSNRGGHGLITLTQGIEYSCNCVLMDVAAAMGAKSFSKYQKLLNFGQKTGIDLPGEAPGILLDEKNLNPAELATSSFGQSFNITMVQMAAAYSSLINGGYYYQPHVVSRVVNQKGITTYSAVDTLMKLTVSKETSDYMRYATRMVVDEGTASLARVEGYRVGGKTGTAQKGNRDDHLFVVSFIGSVPADNPQLVSYVVMDQIDDEENHNSSHLASKMTSDILGRVLPHLGIYPESGEIDYHVGEFKDETNDGLVIDEGEDDSEHKEDEEKPTGPDEVAGN